MNGTILDGMPRLSYKSDQLHPLYAALLGHLVSARNARDWSQSHLASLLGASQRTVSSWEVGSNVPNAERMAQWVLLVGVSEEHLSELLALAIKAGFSFAPGEAREPLHISEGLGAQAEGGAT